MALKITRDNFGNNRKKSNKSLLRFISRISPRLGVGSILQMVATVYDVNISDIHDHDYKYYQLEGLVSPLYLSTYFLTSKYFA